MKLGFIIDSSAGLTQAEAMQRGWNFLPLYIKIDGVEYEDGINILPHEYYKTITLESQVQTSATNPQTILNMFAKASKQYDHVIAYPLSYQLSSQNGTLINLAQEFPNVHVIHSFAISEMIVREVEHLEKLHRAHPQIKIEELLSAAQTRAKQSSALLMTNTMDWLIKGGRVSGTTAALANMLKIIPIIKFDGKLEKFGKGRTLRKTLLKACKHLMAIHDIPQQYDLFFINAGNQQSKALIQELEAFANVKITEKVMPNVVTTHTGPKSIALIAQKKI